MRKMTRKVYRGKRKLLRVTIHEQLRDKLVEIAEEQEMTLSSTVDEFLYRGMLASGRMREGKS